LFFHPIQILSDKARLIKRTQLKRTPYRVLGKSEDEEQITESKEVKTEKSMVDHNIKFLCILTLIRVRRQRKLRIKLNLTNPGLV